MTDRYRSLTVILEVDIRSDDAESLISAIQHLRGVHDVLPNIADSSDLIARSRARAEIREAVMGIFDD